MISEPVLKRMFVEDLRRGDPAAVKLFVDSVTGEMRKTVAEYFPGGAEGGRNHGRSDDDVADPGQNRAAYFDWLLFGEDDARSW